MIRHRIGIDTSILVRLAIERPPQDFSRSVRRIEALVAEGYGVFASNQVIGEAYMALQHHYGISKDAAQSALFGVLTSGLVAPLNDQAVLDALQASGGPGLFDRLITNGYSQAGLQTLTLDRGMASLPDAMLV